MKFTYRCEFGHVTESDFKVGCAPEQMICPVRGPINSRNHMHGAKRDFAADFASVTIGAIDPFRCYHLSTKKEAAAQRQQREIGGPTDSFERKRLERDHGIRFIGDDTSTLKPKAQRGIEEVKAKIKAGELAV